MLCNAALQSRSLEKRMTVTSSLQPSQAVNVPRFYASSSLRGDRGTHSHQLTWRSSPLKEARHVFVNPSITRDYHNGKRSNTTRMRILQSAAQEKILHNTFPSGGTKFRQRAFKLRVPIDDVPLRCRAINPNKYQVPFRRTSRALEVCRLESCKGGILSHSRPSGDRQVRLKRLPCRGFGRPVNGGQACTKSGDYALGRVLEKSGEGSGWWDAKAAACPAVVRLR
jgi:hypothetical protein